jgi:hypothetical protein
MNIKTTKTRIYKVDKDKKSKQTMAKISLNPILNVKDESFKKEHKVCKLKFKRNFILITYKNLNMKSNKVMVQNYI